MRDIGFLLATYEGREFIMDILTETGAIEDPYGYGEHRDYACGKKSVGLDLLHRILQTDNSSYKIMLDEKTERDKQEAVKNERDRERSENRDDDGDEFGVNANDKSGESGGYFISNDAKGRSGES